MKLISKTLATLAVAGLVLTGCGKNPFGPGAAGGLSIFAKIGKAMAKPAAINEEENGKEGSKNTVASGVAAKARLEKGFANQASPSWMISSGIEARGGDTLVYFEEVAGKPNENEPQKITTGRGEVAFKYNGTYTGMAGFNTALISDVYSWKFIGREKKTWNSEVCSLQAVVNFTSGDLQNPSTIRPGYTEVWGKVIESSTRENNLDDTAHFYLDSALDEANSIQNGGGDYYDARSGKNADEGPKAFSFKLQVLHMNTYLNYEDNQGIMTFAYPHGETGDSLYFLIHFYPNYERTGTIRKNSQDGPVVVEFATNDKTGASTVTYYNDDGEEIETENTNN